MLLLGQGRFKVAHADRVELVLLLVQVAVLEPEDDARYEREDGHDAVVPDEERVARERDKRLADRARERRHEQEHAHDERAHVLRRLGERVLEAGDRREDLGEGDQHVRARLDPDVERRHERVAVRVLARRRAVTARVRLVDVVLDDGGPDHRGGAGEEARSDLFERREVDANAAQGGVDEEIEDGDADDEGEGVEVGKNVVGDTVRGHGSRLRSQVVVQLVVGEPWRECECLDVPTTAQATYSR